LIEGSRESSVWLFKDAASVSPSPWGEGRVEGERLNHLVEALMALVSNVSRESSAWLFKDAANVSPSPWGEGRDEGER
jgi:hypothetical protein